MTGDQRHLLAQVRSSSRNYAKTKREAERIVARAGKERSDSFKAAIRGGLSNQEVAQAAGVTKQRVQQVVKSR